MLLRCTKELISWLHYDYREPCAIYDDLYVWGAAYIPSEGFHYHLLLRNSATGFALLFDTADGEELPIISEETIREYLKRGLTAHGFDSEDVAFYLQEGEDSTFTKEFESAYERKKLKDLSSWVVETGLKEAQQSISSLPVTINRRKVDAKALFGDLLKERRKEITKELHLAISLKVRLRLSPGHHVWRRFHLPKDLTYRDLHEIIQIAFGWDGSHLHEFKLGKWVRIMPRDDIERDFGWDDSELLDEEEVTLADAIMKKMTYIYDFGDSWIHDITLEKVITVEEEPIPICVAGEGSAPVEDSGGIWGFLRLLDREWDDDEDDEVDEDGEEDDEGDEEFEVIEDAFAVDEEYDEEDEDYDEDGFERKETPFDQEYINARLKRLFG
jgi:hypothetical protein